MKDLSHIETADLFTEMTVRTISGNQRMIDGGPIKLIESMAEYLSPQQCFQIAEALRDCADRVEHVYERVG